MGIRPRRRFFSTYNAPYFGVLAVIVALIPVAIEPMLNSQKYSKFNALKISELNIKSNKNVLFFSTESIQKTTRANIVQEEVQPGSKYSHFLELTINYFQICLFHFIYRYESLVRSICQKE